MIKKTFIIALILSIISLIIYGQEVLRPLEYNPAKWGTYIKNQTSEEPPTPLLLPFWEDFSYPGPYPDTKLWADSFAFVNPTYAVHPKTIGSATFDALNQYGEIYPEAADNMFQFSADFLTSRPIRLDSVFEPAPMALTPADSIYLSFYFQPQGRGSSPRERDSLVVEFLHTPGYFTEDPDNPGEEIWVDDLWESVWRAEGQTLQEFYLENDSTWFKRVFIKINNEVYFRPDFQFRFRNYASYPLMKTPTNYAGNISIWNVDYINLNYGRSVADTFYYDIAFAAPAQSLLRKFRAMPWSHYIANPQGHLRNRFDVKITNLDNITYNYIYRYFIEDETGTVIRNYSGGTWNIAPFYQQGYQTYEYHANPLIVSSPNPLPLTPAPSREFTIYHVIREGTVGDDFPRNDTIRFHQVFDNYFAYDDGIPESGYGLVGNNARGAVRFVLSHTDSLKAVQFFFNTTLNDQNHQPFHLKVWKNLDPAEILYESEVLTVETEPGIAQFVTYPLDPPILVSDTIYVGWKQVGNYFINMGFDATGNAGNEIFYNAQGQWLPSIFEGALMIRPLVGQSTLTGIDTPELRAGLSLYPNPVRGNFLNIDYNPDDTSGKEIMIFDAGGRVVYKEGFHRNINVASFNNGMYLLRIINADGSYINSGKFIIAR